MPCLIPAIILKQHKPHYVPILQTKVIQTIRKPERSSVLLSQK